MCLCLKENTIFETLPLERCKLVSANNKLRIIVRTHSVVSEELLNIPSVKRVWITLARWTNSNCS